MTAEEYMIYKTMYEEKCEELEVYKKALDLACGGMVFNYCKSCKLENSYVNCSDCKTKEGGWVDYYLDMARDEK